MGPTAVADVCQKPQTCFLQEVNDCYLELFQSHLYFQSVGSNGLTYQVGHLQGAARPNWGHWVGWPRWDGPLPATFGDVGSLKAILHIQPKNHSQNRP